VIVWVGLYVHVGVEKWMVVCRASCFWKKQYTLLSYNNANNLECQQFNPLRKIKRLQVAQPSGEK